MDKNHIKLDIFSLFVISVNEYIEFSILINNNENKMNEDVTIKAKSMLLRKYITRNDSVHVGKIIEKLLLKYKKEEKYLTDLKNKYMKVYQGSIVQIDSMGNEYSQIEVFEDIIYGLYLHADAERVERLLYSSNASKMYMLNKFIIEIEGIILELYKFINERTDINRVEKLPLIRADVIRSRQTKNNSALLEEGYWGNLIGEKVSNDSIIRNNLDDEDIKIIKTVLNFFEFFQYDRISYIKAKKFIFRPVLKDWYNFNEVKRFVQNIGSNMGFSNKIKYNEEKTVAWMTVFKNVDYAFVISTPQQVEATTVTLVKNNFGNWKIFAIGGKIDNPFDSNY